MTTPTPSNPLDAVCAKCGSKKGEHSMVKLHCPESDPKNGIWTLDRFTPLAPWPDNVTIKVGAQYRQKSTGLLFRLLDGDSTTNQIGLYVQAPEWHGTVQDMLAEFDLVVADAPTGEPVAGNVNKEAHTHGEMEVADIDVYTRARDVKGFQRIYKRMCNDNPKGPPYGMRVITVDFEHLGRLTALRHNSEPTAEAAYPGHTVKDL